jgi:hypothetical protein
MDDSIFPYPLFLIWIPNRNELPVISISVEGLTPRRCSVVNTELDEGNLHLTNHNCKHD